MGIKNKEFRKILKSCCEVGVDLNFECMVHGGENHVIIVLDEQGGKYSIIQGGGGIDSIPVIWQQLPIEEFLSDTGLLPLERVN